MTTKAALVMILAGTVVFLISILTPVITLHWAKNTPARAIEPIFTLAASTTAESSQVFAAVMKTTKYRCPVCGSEETSSAAWRAGIAVMNIDDKVTYHCSTCYGRWIRKHVPEMVEVKVDSR